MTAKNDWRAAIESFTAEERERLGGPPSAEEVVAFLRGEVSDAEAARIRALLVYYPGLTDLLAGRRDPSPLRRAFAIAAALIIATLTALLVRSQYEVQRLNDALEQPQVHARRHVLLPMRQHGARGSPVYLLPADEQHYLLAPTVAGDPQFSEYRIELHDLVAGRTIWSARVAARNIEVSVPRKFLRPGIYRLEMHGIHEEASHPLGSYLIRVPELSSQ